MLNETFSVIFKHCAHVFSNSNLFKEHSNHFEKLVLFKSCVEINEVGWSFPTEKLYNIDMALEFKRELPMSDDPQEVSKIYHENWVRN